MEARKRDKNHLNFDIQFTFTNVSENIKELFTCLPYISRNYDALISTGENFDICDNECRRFSMLSKVPNDIHNT